MDKGRITKDGPTQAFPLHSHGLFLTDCGVPDKGLFVLQHRVHGEFLAVLGCDDGNGRLFVGRDRGHLLDHPDLRVLVMDARERVELHGLDEAAILQREQDDQHFLSGPAIVARRRTE